METKKKEKRKLMVWIEVYGGQRSLAFELTTVKLASRARPLFQNIKIQVSLENVIREAKYHPNKDNERRKCLELYSKIVPQMCSS